MLVFAIAFMLFVAAPVWAADVCPIQLQESQIEARIVDNQRARAVQDLATANRLINEWKAKAQALEKDLAKAKEPAKETK